MGRKETGKEVSIIWVIERASEHFKRMGTKQWRDESREEVNEENEEAHTKNTRTEKIDRARPDVQFLLHYIQIIRS